MYTEDQLLPISALQHLIFCERQCALIHVERLWAENRLTVEGRHLHDKAHTETTQNVKGVRVARGLRLHSFELGLYGQADVVEFRALEESANSTEQSLHVPVKPHEKMGKAYQTTPIEYKRGKPKKDDSDRVQLCAQAMCLEEMLSCTIDAGQLFYGKQRRRTNVQFDSPLRDATKERTRRLHGMIAHRETPAADFQPKCNRCSLLYLCLPRAMRFKTGAAAFVDRSITAHHNSEAPHTDDFDFIG